MLQMAVHDEMQPCNAMQHALHHVVVMVTCRLC